MLTVLFGVLVVVAVAYGLWSAQHGEGETVLGDGNNFTSYYEKAKIPNPAKSLPCDECVRLGCIGAGECRCVCHKKSA